MTVGDHRRDPSREPDEPRDRPADPPPDRLDDDRTVAADELPEDLDALLAGADDEPRLGSGEPSSDVDGAFDDLADDRTVAADPSSDTALSDDVTVPADDLPPVPAEPGRERTGDDDPWIRPTTDAVVDEPAPAPVPEHDAAAAPPAGPGSGESVAPTAPGTNATDDHTVDSGTEHPVVAPAASRPSVADDDERWRPPTRTGGALATGSTRSWPAWLVPVVAAVVVATIIVLVVLL